MHLLDNLGGDLRLALRSLARDRGFTVTAVLTYALCLGANVALFAVVNAVLLRPLPFAAADQLVAVDNAYPKAGVPDAIGVSVPHYLERRAQVAAFADAAAYRDSGETIGDAGSPDRVDAMSVTPSFFPLLGAKAALGRTFADEEGIYGKNSVVILSDALWRQKFAADPAVIGRQVRLGGAGQSTVIGVMPPGFRFLSSRAQLWTPLCFNDDDRKPESRHSNNMAMMARLKPGTSVAAAQEQVNALNQAALATDPYAKLVVDAGFHTEVRSLHDKFTRQMRPAMLLLQAGVLFLLLIGVINLANLLLVRATGRAKELSIRQVLGAGSGRIAAQIVTETLALTLGGSLLGLALGWAGLRGLDILGTADLPHSGDFRLDTVVCLAALGASVVVGLLLALPVIWHASHGSLAASLSVESRGGTTSRATHRLRHTLIVAQFALAFVLLAGAGLLGLSFSRLLAVKPGFQPDHVLTGVVPLPWNNYKEVKQRIDFLTRLAAELKTIPGITAVGFSTGLPFSGANDVNAISVEGREMKEGDTLLAHNSSGVTGDYFTALGIPLVEGRFLTADDTARSAKVCVVDEAVARLYWPGQSALGHRLFNGPVQPKEEPFTIVGVVGTVKQNDLADKGAVGAVYFPYGHYAGLQVMLTVRTTQQPEAVGPSLRTAVLKVDPDLPVADLKTLEGRIGESLVTRRAPLVLTALFAAVALALAGVGLYGVLAYAVSQRRREIGVRMALGAQPEQIRGQFLGLGVRLVLVGVVLGVAGAWFCGRAMGSLLFGVGAVHPGILAATAGALVLIALAACVFPAQRAARVPPMEALRGD